MKSNKLKLAEKDVKAIEEIISRNSTAEVKRAKDGVIVVEVRKTIKKGFLAESCQ